MSTGTAEPALTYVADAFTKETGHRITISYRYDLDECDVLVMSQRSLDVTSEHGGFSDRIEQGRVRIGRNSGVGVAIRRGAGVPDISNEQAVIKSVLAADRILIVENHSSGLHMEGLFRKHGIYDQVRPKFVYRSIGQDLVDRLLGGEGNEIMFLSIGRTVATTDQRLVFLGPLPDTMQLTQDYFAVPMTSSAKKDVARQFAKYCGGPGRAIFLANRFS